MSKSDLIAAAAAKTGLTKKDTEASLNAILESIEEALKERKKVQLIGFGSFQVKHRAERPGRNPSTGDPITIAATDSVSFSASKKLNEGL